MYIIYWTIHDDANELGTLNTTIFYWIIFVIFFLVMKLVLFQNNADGGDGEAVETYGAACSIDSFFISIVSDKIWSKQINQIQKLSLFIIHFKKQIKID